MRCLPRRLILGLTAVFSLCIALSAQETQYTAGQTQIDGVDFPYLLLGPTKIEEGKTYPLVLFLHGSGERGNDNEEQKRHFPERMEDAQAKFGTACFVLAPQCPEKGGWTNFPDAKIPLYELTKPATPPLQAAMQALQEVVGTYPIDTDRIALTGISMGGFGVWELVARHPDWFSAVVPICGGGKPKSSLRYAGLPFQVWHGAEDGVVHVSNSRSMVRALNHLELKVEYHELEGVEHDSWVAAYEDKSCIDFLLNSRRDPAGMQATTARLLGTALDPEERIAFLGDSITQSGNAKGGYVDLIRSSLQPWCPEATIIPAGISGHKVPDLLARYENDVLKQEATLVFLYIGINDVWHSTQDKGTPKEVFEMGLRELIQKLRASGAEVVLATPSTIGEKTRGDNPLDGMLEEYAAISRRVAAEEGATLCDLRNSFFDHLRIFNAQGRDKGILTSDGVHLNAAGNTFVAIEAARSLRQAARLRSKRRAAEEAK